MPNPNLDSENGGSQGSLAPWGSAVNFGQWSANALARWFATYAPGFYSKAGGNLVLFTPSSPQPNYIGGFTGPQEVAQMYDARKVVTYMLNHLDETYQQELALSLYVPLGPNAFVGPGGYDPMKHLLWTPGNELAAVANAFTQGIIPEQAFRALVGLGYDLPHAAELLDQYLSGFTNGEANQAESDQPDWLCGPNGRLLAYIEIQQYVNKDGTIGALQANEPQVPIGNEYVYVPMDAQMCAQEGQAFIAKFPPGTPAFDYPKSWKEVLYNIIAHPPGTGSPQMGAQYAGAGIGFEHLTLAYQLAYGDQNDAKNTFLAQIDNSLLSRFEAVTVEAAIIAKKVRQGAVQNKIAYGIWNYIASVPLTPTDIKATRLGASYANGEFPKRLTTWLVTGYNGLPPIVDSSQVPAGFAWYTPDWNGKPKTALIALDPKFQEAFESLWRARLAYYACTGGNKRVNFGEVSSGVSSLFGTLLNLAINPDQSPALPYYTDNSLYSNLGGPVSDTQLANAFTSVAADIGLAPLLGLQSGVDGAKNTQRNNAPLFNEDVFNDFVSTPNNQAMLQAWLRVDPKVLKTFTPKGTLITIPPAPPVQDVDIGPYGSLNLQTA